VQSISHLHQQLQPRPNPATAPQHPHRTPPQLPRGARDAASISSHSRRNRSSISSSNRNHSRLRCSPPLRRQTRRHSRRSVAAIASHSRRSSRLRHRSLRMATARRRTRQGHRARAHLFGAAHRALSLRRSPRIGCNLAVAFAHHRSRPGTGSQQARRRSSVTHSSRRISIEGTSSSRAARASPLRRSLSPAPHRGRRGRPPPSPQRHHHLRRLRLH